jgi:hypothetical protein
MAQAAISIQKEFFTAEGNIHLAMSKCVEQFANQSSNEITSNVMRTAAIDYQFAINVIDAMKGNFKICE